MVWVQGLFDDFHQGDFGGLPRAGQKRFFDQAHPVFSRHGALDFFDPGIHQGLHGMVWLCFSHARHMHHDVQVAVAHVAKKQHHGVGPLFMDGGQHGLGCVAFHRT